MKCLNCGQEMPIFRRMARLYESAFACPNCGHRREMRLTHRIDGTEGYATRTLSEFDMPPLGIIRARNGTKRIFLELTGDKVKFFKFE